MEVDVDPKNRPDRVDDVDGAVGEGSPFHGLHGFYVQGVSIETASLPEGWRDRTIPVENENTRGCRGLCLEAHDLASSKLVANRPKDREFVRIMLREGLADLRTLLSRIATLPVGAEIRVRLRTWVEATAEELGLS